MSEQYHGSGERAVKLQNESPEIFTMFVKMLYGDTLLTMAPKKTDLGGDSDTDGYISLFKLYVLVEKLEDIESKEMISDRIQQFTTLVDMDGPVACPPPCCIKIVYEGTPSGDPARRLLIELYVSYQDKTCLSGAVDSVPKEFLYDLSLHMLENQVQRPYKELTHTLRVRNRTGLKSLAERKKQLEEKDRIIRSLEGEVQAKDIQISNLTSEIVATKGRIGSFSEEGREMSTSSSLLRDHSEKENKENPALDGKIDGSSVPFRLSAKKPKMRKRAIHESLGD
ncbi:uncharacterized protein BDR25DRAFT_314689 [Lindgomyces ingoldianus]|uniref:Uncharacterized protein n=1 Tax=Lindgomyces ingoldianus TaxID=673940 RepID=A0ACB6QWQ1_9PLEO|nr:uncharacterized protein BDR25DRAFT_314689 [Lindgomyces ingoldianus]KAF2470510.1 hypothetical protein BDR25DRAFT_314689 [Lindgomyces ingoldianus]